MPSKGKYIAGKQVSRWEADSDNIDIEYKNLESRHHAPPWLIDCFSGRKGLVLKVLIVVVVFFLGLVLGYVIQRDVKNNFEKPAKPSYIGIQQDYDPEFSKKIRDDLKDKVNLEDHLNILSGRNFSRLSGVGSTGQVLEYVRNDWSIYFDDVKLKKYTVSLSYPDYTNVSTVQMVTANRSVFFQCRYNESNIHPEYFPFNAYSPAATVTAPLVYANFGSVEDYVQLESLNVSVNGSIVIIKYGKTHPGSKVKHAEDHGAVGVLLYADPADYANNQSNVYPDTWWLPGWAVRLSHVRYMLIGDPSTPDYSSKVDLYRIPDSSASYPRIPVQPISYDDARILLRDLKGSIVPNEWFGGLNIVYRTGPGHPDGRLIEMSLRNTISTRVISNIIAIVRGQYEKDKYIIIGAHSDSWTEGAVDAGSGYSILRELARTFSVHGQHGWRPRRTIIFALWDASKYGHIGSYEWVQEYEKQLGVGAVAYINLEAVIRGNYSFYAEASPLLYSVIINATKVVKCPDPDHQDMSVYDMWVKKFPGQQKSLPEIKTLKGDSDHSPFMYHMGIPSMSTAYTYNTTLYPNLPSFPGSDALDDTPEYLTKFIDPKLDLHVTLSQVLADVILRLADSALLPLDVHNYIQIINSGKQLLNTVDFEAADVKRDTLFSAMENFTAAVEEFSTNFTRIDKNTITEFEVYLLNDQLIQLSRAFVITKGLPNQPQYRNVLVSPDPEALNKETAFPGLILGLEEGKRTSNWNTLKEQMTYLTIALQTATDILQDRLIR